jgi:hypothetical protein
MCLVHDISTGYVGVIVKFLGWIAFPLVGGLVGGYNA